MSTEVHFNVIPKMLLYSQIHHQVRSLFPAPHRQTHPLRFSFLDHSALRMTWEPRLEIDLTANLWYFIVFIFIPMDLWRYALFYLSISLNHPVQMARPLAGTTTLSDTCSQRHKSANLRQPLEPWLRGLKNKLIVFQPKESLTVPTAWVSVLTQPAEARSNGLGLYLKGY